MATLPVTPAIDLRTETIKAANVSADTNVMAAAVDGTLWCVNTINNLSVFSPSRGQFVSVGSITYGGSSLHVSGLAPVNEKLVYCLGSTPDGSRVISAYQKGAGFSDVPALPSDSPVALTAGGDGTVWALGESGMPYALHGNLWTPLPAPPSTQFKTLSVGNAAFGLALVNQNGALNLLQFADGDWKPLSLDLVPNLTLVGACPDGSYWTRIGPRLILYPSGESQVTFELQGSLLSQFCAPSRHGCYYLNPLAGAYTCAAYGALDQPAVGWPVMTAGQQAAYDAISEKLTSDPDGIRGQYANLNVSISDLHAKVLQMDRPEEVSPDDWKSVQSQIGDELDYVAAVRNLFNNIKQLNNEVNNQRILTYNAVIEMVGLPAPPDQQPTTTVQVILGEIFDKLLDAAIDKAPASAAKVIKVGISIFKFAADQIAKEHGVPDSNTKLAVACSKLADTLNSICDQMVKTCGDFEKAIVTDWGKLSACGQAINSDVWYWDPDFDFSVLQGMGDSTRLNFYQTLIPAKWQISQIVTVFARGLSPYLVHAPAYTFVYKTVADSQTAEAVFWWWVCTQQGTDVSPWTNGPFPNKTLIDTIAGLTNIYDFFRGANGWSLPVVSQSEFKAPSDDVPWQDWQDSADPLK